MTILSIDIPDEIYDDATNQLGSHNTTVEKKVVKYVSEWALEYRKSLYRSQYETNVNSIDQTDILNFKESNNA
jgi:hypothetical protein